MGTKGKAIVKLNVTDLVTKLNKALADEWLAYYQYWVGAKVAKGPMRGAVVAELLEHAGEELKHAEMLSDRIIQLGGTPILNPEDWFKLTNCKYDAPTDPHVKRIVEQNISAEQCAIDVYRALTELTMHDDPLTYHITLEILSDEVEHEEDLQALKEDMELIGR